jgi:hypothetical protein
VVIAGMTPFQFIAPLIEQVPVTSLS